MFEICKLDEKCTVLLDLDGHDNDIPHFFIAYEVANMVSPVELISICLDKPEYVTKYTQRISQKTAEKLFNAMKSDIEINEPNFYLKGIRWSFMVWLWNNHIDEYGIVTKQVSNDLSFMPNYMDLETID